MRTMGGVFQSFEGEEMKNKNSTKKEQQEVVELAKAL